MEIQSKKSIIVNNWREKRLSKYISFSKRISISFSAVKIFWKNIHLKESTFDSNKIFTKVQEHKKIRMPVKINSIGNDSSQIHVAPDFPGNEIISHFYVSAKHHQNISK